MKRATIYFDDGLHRALKIKAFEGDLSISHLVNVAVRDSLEDDLEDLKAIETRKKEKPVTYSSFLKELKSRGKI